MQPNNFTVKNLNVSVGSYAISTIDFHSWTKDPVKQPSQKGRRIRGSANKEIVNRIFSECALVTQDPFWANKFNEAAIGKFPRKFSFHNGQLIYRKGAKCNILEVIDEPYEASRACMEFFRVNGGIFSSMDEQISLELQYNRAQAALTQERLTWDTSNKRVQECLLSYYITNIKQTMTLSDKEVEQLRQTIRLGIVGKYFGKHNIKVVNTSIQSIDGLFWDEDTRSFYISPDIKPNLTRTYTRKKDQVIVDPTQKDTIPQFSAKWEKYVEALDKKRIKGARRQHTTIINNSPTISEDVTSQTDVTTEDDN